uniref:U-reduvitoxin-Pr4a n=1 Tax=Platymeris rhadamanthus TaxID=1134088 RepID=PLK4A_PLARH|nr:RecName: Full=U-reduvitoxin-Pr4a; Short=U-RDTX-Pr4a; Flags: Precursor [Platymeris rhadamanthus]QHB21537.1 venom Ptu1 family peptide Pr4a [Platymeris rhadamanthus]
MKIFGLFLLIATYMALAFAGEDVCIPSGQKCGPYMNMGCCKGLVCMSYAARCVSMGGIPRMHI